MINRPAAAPVYDRPYVRIYVDPARRLLLTEWEGFALSDELRGALDEALRLARLHGVRFWLADYRRRRIIAPEDQTWVSEVWLPRLRDLGLRRLAIVESESAFGRLSVDGILTRARDHISWDTHYFADRAAAEVWVTGAGT